MTVKNAINWRKTIKKYDSSKTINNNDLSTIIEAGRLAPCSLGLEVTNVVTITNKELKTKFAEEVMSGSNQEKVQDANCIMIVAGVNPEHLVSTEFLTKRLERNIIQPDVLKITIDKYQTFLTQKENLFAFVSEQAHIVTSFITLQAADLKIGSTIMGGFNVKKCNDLLSQHCFFDQTKLHSVLVLALGYYDETDEKTSLPRVRIDFNEFVKIIK
ncbi:oxygen-insensitive NAD(P)H nitroreductase [Spiroplasma sp. NBRC 100390]|uniref:nitroreductase family protein n=1 Tax=unclassified Spiroplasma TaxID=2637901 RepID=UPI0008928B54|nr:MULTISPECIES: nitroreductase family protein [unclassified Spiroplasma]AOX43372.1 oxygen-insensitive NAD(P)H nitroreductase [Spiroplasma sp. TU-14]APE12842.1 oxygen-insensitive NAD(P)H nitroreductase [Spiroplasma sp. NBRC 100390]